VLPRTPSFRLDGRKALVTGAARGIGLALAEAGAEVTLAARSITEIQAGAMRAARAAARRQQPGLRLRISTRSFFAERAAFPMLVDTPGSTGGCR
jgi:NAD(P)-dependent dehydrogenase (short-subunit alcohol dehydrogenase family)